MRHVSDKRYLSFLLRMWVSSANGQSNWRVLLEDPRTGERLWFSSLQRLCEFLEDQGGRAPADEPAPPSRGVGEV